MSRLPIYRDDDLDFTDSKALICYHEAGHAVAGLALHRYTLKLPSSLWVCEEEREEVFEGQSFTGSGWWGRYQAFRSLAEIDDDKPRGERCYGMACVVTGLAGVVAEELANGGCFTAETSDTDEFMIEQGLALLAETEQEQNRWRDRLWGYAVRLLEREWERVERVAEALYCREGLYDEEIDAVAGYPLEARKSEQAFLKALPRPTRKEPTL